MSFENAKANLKEFGKELNLEGLAFDENHTCILGIDNTFSLHLTYEPNSDRLYLYSPILDGLPKDDPTKLKLYESLLEGSMLGGQMAGGGIGVAVKEELILMHCVLEMGPGADPASLRRFAPLFVESVEKWRERAKAIFEGREPPKDFGGGSGMQQRGGQQQGKPQEQPKPGERFIKI
ncbi:MAG: CesT family type III secretion system chaperone [Simkania negevensis]|nr:CesT family type III secretion system chaperone [Simkania negevensis]